MYSTGTFSVVFTLTAGTVGVTTVVVVLSFTVLIAGTGQCCLAVLIAGTVLLLRFSLFVSSDRF
jgi:hypothetical protein